MKTFLFLVASFCCLIGSAQTITGKIVDTEHQPIGYVNVTLQHSDSTFVSGTISNDSGHFSLVAPSVGNYLLSASYMGYTSASILVNNLSGQMNLGEIVMQESAISLADITVTASRVNTRVDRQVVIPMAEQAKMSLSGLDLLNKMMLPGLKIDPIQNTISTVGGGSVQVRINGIKATNAQMQAIDPKGVIRMEYIDNPGVQYGEDQVDAVINFVVKRVDSGVSGGVQLNNALTTGFGEDLVYLRGNYKESEFGLQYALSYRDLDKRRVDETEIFALSDNSLRNRIKEGIGVPFFYAIHQAELSYNWVKPEKVVLNVSLKDRFYNSPDRDFSQIIRENGQEDIRTYTWSSDKNHSPSLDLYSRVSLPHQQEITFNVVGTYIYSDFLRDYNEFLLANEDVPEYRSMYQTKGKKYSLIAEAVYEKSFSGAKLTGGAQFMQSYTNNKYSGANETSAQMHNRNSYVYMQLQGKLWQKLNYMLGAGVSQQKFGDSDNGFTFYTFRPSIMLSYPLFNGTNVRYSFSISPTLPSLSDLTEVAQQIDRFQLKMGNSALNPYRSQQHTLLLAYNKSKLSMQLKGEYVSRSNPIMQQVTRITEDEDDYFVYTMDNQKRHQMLKGQLFVQYQLVPRVLSLSAFGGVAGFKSVGHTYKHSYTTYYAGGQIDATFGDWNVGGSVWSRTNSLFGETILYGERGSQAYIRYKLKKEIMIGVSALFPFQAQGLRVGTKRLTEIAEASSWTSSKNFGNLILLNLKWTFNSGKKFVNTQKVFKNEDIDSGIVK